MCVLYPEKGKGSSPFPKILAVAVEHSVRDHVADGRFGEIGRGVVLRFRAEIGASGQIVTNAAKHDDSRFHDGLWRVDSLIEHCEGRTHHVEVSDELQVGEVKAEGGVVVVGSVHVCSIAGRESLVKPLRQECG